MSKVKPVQHGERIVSHHLLLRRAKRRQRELTLLSTTQDANENWISDAYFVRRALTGPWRWYVVRDPGPLG